jgi:hypothetical protein
MVAGDLLYCEPVERFRPRSRAATPLRLHVALSHPREATDPPTVVSREAKIARAAR